MTSQAIFIFLVLIAGLQATAQQAAPQPQYTPKHLVARDDEREFVREIPKDKGFSRAYILAQVELWDVDDRKTGYVKGDQTALICIEGEYNKGHRDGAYSVYVIDSADHRKRYKIWEQNYKNDKLNGEWKVYSLKGDLVSFQTFKDDSLDGMARNLWIDGKSIMEEREYFNGRNKYILRKYDKNGKPTQEATFVNGIPNGPAKKYYSDGVLKDEAILVNGAPNGQRTFYYPSGKLWLVQIMKDGKPWTIISNHDQNGKERDPGTLKDGTGTLIFYNDDGTVRDTISYRDGLESK